VQREGVQPVALIVHPDGNARAAIRRTLRNAGFQAVAVDTFDAARHMLELEPVDVLVTEARLGDFHGLHLVLIARYGNPAVFAAVLTGERDEVLERDVERAGGVLFVGDHVDAIVGHIERMSLPRAAGDSVQ
jgi:DNA-binding response OmpR family regulator